MPIYDTNLMRLISFAESYTKIEDRYQEEFKRLVDGRWNDVRPEAVESIKGVLGGLNWTLDALIEGYEEYKGEEEEEVPAGLGLTAHILCSTAHERSNL